MLYPSDKKPLAVLAAVVAVVIVAVAALTAVLVSGHEDSPPRISVQAGDTLVRAEPAYWCAKDMTDCTPVDPRQVDSVRMPVARAAAPIGSTAVVSVPGEIAEGPWFVFAQYATPRGVERVRTLQRSGSTFTLALHSTPDRVLLGMDIQVLSTVLENSPNGLDSDTGSILMRGIYSVDTRPDGYTVSNPTQLPDVRE